MKKLVCSLDSLVAASIAIVPIATTAAAAPDLPPRVPRFSIDYMDKSVDPGG